MYNDGFTPEEYASFKTLIQANIYKYMAILLEGREHFEEEDDELANVSAKNHLDDTSVVSKENGDPSSSQPGMMKLFRVFSELQCNSKFG